MSYENVREGIWNILSRVGCVTRQITSRCQGCSEYLLRFASTLIQSSNSITVKLYLGQYWTSTVSCGVQAPTVSFGGYFQTVFLRMYCLLICLRPLLLNETFVVTVETPVRITIELLLLPMQRAVLAFPWK
jgi:hypothetical protein